MWRERRSERKRLSKKYRLLRMLILYIRRRWWRQLGEYKLRIVLTRVRAARRKRAKRNPRRLDHLYTYIYIVNILYILIINH